MRLFAGADIGHADQDFPCALRNRSGQARGGGIHDADSESGLIPAAPAAEASWIEQSKIERSVLLLAGVSKGDGHALSLFGNRKWHVYIALVLRSMHGAFKDELGPRWRSGRRLLREGGDSGKRRSKKKAE
jgi:hypothetical protein